MVTQPLAQPVSTFLPFQDPLPLACEQEAETIHKKLDEEIEERRLAALRQKIKSNITFVEDLKKELNPAPSASEVAAKESAKREEDEKRKKDEEELHRLRDENKSRKLTQQIQTALSPIDATVKDLKKAEEERQQLARIERAATQSKLEGRAEGRAEAIKDIEERYGRTEGRGRRSRLRSRTYSRDFSSERSRSRSRYWSRDRYLGGEGGSRGAHESGQGATVNGLYNPQALIQLGAGIATLQSPRGSGYTSQPLIGAPSTYNALQRNQVVSYAGGRTFPSYPDTDIVYATEFDNTVRGISGTLEQLGQKQEAVLDRIGRVDTKVTQGNQQMMNRFGHIDMTLEDLSQRFRAVGI